MPHLEELSIIWHKGTENSSVHFLLNVFKLCNDENIYYSIVNHKKNYFAEISYVTYLGLHKV